MSSIDASQNSALRVLWSQNNQLNSLDVRNGNNTNVYWFKAQNNPNLTCIQVDNAAYSSGQSVWTDNIDAGVNYNENYPSIQNQKDENIYV